MTAVEPDHPQEGPQGQPQWSDADRIGGPTPAGREDARCSETRREDHEEATREYHRLIRFIHKEWDDLESRTETSVMPSARVMQAVMEAVRADTRHGAQVQMPDTDLGPFTLTELSLRTLVRGAVDSVPGARALCSSAEYAPATDGHRGLGRPEAIHCRISAHITCPDLPTLAQWVREAVRKACDDNLAIRPDVDVHVEDLHDED